MKRTAIIIAWLASLIAAYLLGQMNDGPARAGLTPEARAPSGLQDDGAGPLAGARGNPSGSLVAAARTEPVATAERLAAAGRPFEAIQLLEDHLAVDGQDAEALFLLSDLRQMTGDVDLALLPLIAILRFPPTPQAAARARQRLDLLINAREQQLINTGDLVGLVAYFEQLVAAEPGNDSHRLKLARWLLRSGDAEDAARLLKETGLVGVEQEEVEALAREIELSQASVPVEQIGGAMYAQATVSGRKQTREFRFLIDTGATMSGLAAEKLEALGARMVNEGIAVQTANGVVRLPVYRLRELRIGALVLEDLQVLGFDELPRHAEGLLGMDVLSRLSGGGPAAVGLP